MRPPYTYFGSVWVVVVAVSAGPGERLEPLALAAKDFGTGSLIEIGVPKLYGVRRPPYPTGSQALLITIGAHEVIACHLALGWRVPERIVDLMVEFRNVTNGERRPIVGGLAGALLWFGRPATAGFVAGISTEQTRQRLEAVAGLFEAMWPSLDLGRALLRGRYMCAVARIEAVGVPVDEENIERLTSAWPAVRDRVIEIIDRGYGVHRGRRLDVEAFAFWLDRHGIAWPLLDSGRLDLGDDAFREMARAHPVIRPIKELRATLLGFDSLALTIGRDGCNRTPLRPVRDANGPQSAERQGVGVGKSGMGPPSDSTAAGHGGGADRLATARVWHRGGPLWRPIDAARIQLRRSIYCAGCRDRCGNSWREGN